MSFAGRENPYVRVYIVRALENRCVPDGLGQIRTGARRSGRAALRAVPGCVLQSSNPPDHFGGTAPHTLRSFVALCRQKWVGADSNCRPAPCEGAVITWLDHQPASTSNSTANLRITFEKRPTGPSARAAVRPRKRRVLAAPHVPRRALHDPPGAP